MQCCGKDCSLPLLRDEKQAMCVAFIVYKATYLEELGANGTSRKKLFPGDIFCEVKAFVVKRIVSVLDYHINLLHQHINALYKHIHAVHKHIHGLHKHINVLHQHINALYKHTHAVHKHINVLH